MYRSSETWVFLLQLLLATVLEHTVRKHVMALELGHTPDSTLFDLLSHADTLTVWPYSLFSLFTTSHDPFSTHDAHCDVCMYTGYRCSVCLRTLRGEQIIFWRYIYTCNMFIESLVNKKAKQVSRQPKVTVHLECTLSCAQCTRESIACFSLC